MLILKDIYKDYQTGDEIVHALKDINLSFRKQEFVSILGPSGCGKTTLLNIIGGLDRYTRGDLWIDGISTKQFKDQDWDSYRNHRIGFVFQNYNLISHLSVLGNVEIALTISGLAADERTKRAKDVLIKVGLKDKINKRINQLSGGQLQRVAIARALVNNPSIILADEPTGALDSKSSIQILDLLKEISKDRLIIMVTHNKDFAAAYSDRIIELLDGKIVSDSQPHQNTQLIHKPYVKQKTAMSFVAALLLSFHNLRRKYIKTLIAVIAGGIGVIGVGLVLGIANGFGDYVKVVQTTTNITTPIVIENKVIIDSSIDPDNPPIDVPKNFPKNQNYITSQQTNPPMILEEHTNYITADYLEYLKHLNSNLYYDIKYSYDVSNPTFLIKNKDDEVARINVSTSTRATIGELPFEDEKYLSQVFDILHGDYPDLSKDFDKTSEAVLIIDDNNQLPDTMLEILGFNGYDYEEKISFDALVGIELKFAHSGILYQKNDETEKYVKVSNQKAYEDKESLTLKIVGILRRKPNASVSNYLGIRYTSHVSKHILEETKNAQIVLDQQKIIEDYKRYLEEVKDNPTTEEKKLYSIVPGENITDLVSAEKLLRKLGIQQDPSKITIYQVDGQSRETIKSFLDAYNEQFSESDKDQRIILNEVRVRESWLVDSTLTAIRKVLVIVVVIALFISVSMVSILTYISVIERTPEIGILRSIGARKVDISRVFYAESFIIGLASGIFGVIITYLILPVFNTIFKATLDVNDLVNLDWSSVVLLIVLNIALTLLAGVIPAIVASRKEPVDALRKNN